jgi:hypothetical protein
VLAQEASRDEAIIAKIAAFGGAREVRSREDQLGAAKSRPRSASVIRRFASSHVSTT